MSEKALSGMSPQDHNLPSYHHREQRKTAQRSLSQNLNLQNCEQGKIVNGCLLELLNFGIVCYLAITAIQKIFFFFRNLVSLIHQYPTSPQFFSHRVSLIGADLLPLFHLVSTVISHTMMRCLETLNSLYSS